MKNKFKIGIAAIVMAATVYCASSAQKTAYDALGIASVAVDTGMKVYSDRVVAGAVPQPLQDTVRKDYATYQIVMKDAQAAVNVWLSMGNPAPPALFPAAKVGAALSAAGKIQGEVK
jgi:hypothetical protein